MNIIKLKNGDEIPKNYTGIVESQNEKRWIKNGERHREDGPAVVWGSGHKFWYLDGIIIWFSVWKTLDFTNKIILSKEQHPRYPTCQVLKYIDENGIQEQVVIPGMEEFVIE